MDPVRKLKQNLDKKHILEGCFSNGVDLTSKTKIKEVLLSHQIKPLKSLGQNFLISQKALNDFINACDLKKNDIVLEIGPGLGTITQAIAPKVEKVIAVEKDLKMCEITREILQGFKNIEIVNEDILKYRVVIKNPYKVVGNLPFYITAPVIRIFLESEKPPQEMIFMIQKEVGQRICAEPPNMNLLAVSVQFYSKPKIISYLPKNSFWPQPKVDSAIVKLSNVKYPVLNVNKDLFFKVVKAGFSSPRKQLRNNLSKKLGINKEKTERWLLKNNIQPSQRAETLSVLDWINLVKTLK